MASDPSDEALRPELAVSALLDDFSTDLALPYDRTVQKALLVARSLQERAQELQTPEEKKQQMELDRMIQSPGDKVTLTRLTDQAFRTSTPGRAADQLIHILDMQGVPRFFSPFERTLLKGFQSFGSFLPGVSVPLVKDKMRRETANVILPAEAEILREHLIKRRAHGVRMNVNFLGEAILGEVEAQKRLAQYLEALQRPEIEVVSVKISAVYSQILTIAREHTVRQLCDRMELLFRAAAKGKFERHDGTVVPKFVYLDMEEYRDMTLTTEVFLRTLDRPGLEDVAAGIVFQAYVPDSFAMQQRVTEWARKRVASGGAPVTLRIVKGANMEMERVEASVRDWPQAPYKTKIETDANFKRMVRYALRTENCEAVRPGFASHNLFDISYALVLAFESKAMNSVQFEMLEGMANHQRRALHELSRSVLLYAPACQKKDFIHAIGYLIRRLDENTGEENFLRHAFNITVGSEAWKKLERGFLHSFDALDDLGSAPRRTQDRNRETFSANSNQSQDEEFPNEPDTDFSLPANAEWASEIIATWTERHGDAAVAMPLYVAGREVQGGTRDLRECLDPSRPGTVVGRYTQANVEDVSDAVDCAARDPDGWRSMPRKERHALLRNVACELRRSRADLLGTALADGGKLLTESDPEVSEAIDFVEYYSATARYFESLPTVEARPCGVIVVVSPWNFPLAIPCGGIAAALAAGNTVILKPASSSVLSAHRLCECFYRAGVPRTALQYLPCSGGSVGQTLVSDPRVNTVILTGGTETAQAMLKVRPEMKLLAETGGKNATIVTALSDRDQAIKHVLHSAFSHCGQKCSATSLLLLQEEVFEDEAFRESLVDAVSSLRVSSAWNLESRMGPLNSVPSGDLERGLKELEPGESWLLMPRRDEDNPCLYSPGIKWNVQPGSYTHMTEFFGPLLGVMKFRHLEEAIELTNQTGYGLTSGLESLDDREQVTWLEGIRAGNLYINRPTTGAVVLRQPFGGMGKSAFGPGIKAGGPNYVAQLMTFRSRETLLPDSEPANEALQQFVRALETSSLPADLQTQVPAVLRAITSYDAWAAAEFLKTHDSFRLVGQDNLRRYRPLESVCIRVHPKDSWFELLARTAAARAAGCRSTISVSPTFKREMIDRLHDLTEEWAADIEFVEQSEENLVSSILEGGIARLRFAAPDRVPVAVRVAAAEKFVHVADAPVLEEGRIELLWYFQEQSVCIDYHRYGNLGDRSREERRPVE